MPFPISKHPGAIVFLDDDRLFLEMLGMFMPEDWNVQLFTSAYSFIDYMKGKLAARSEHSYYQQGIIDRWKGGSSLIREVLQYWTASPERYSFPMVALVDYYMPKMNGLTARDECAAWNGYWVFLTGQADDKLIIKAFNDGKIDRYIPKQSNPLAQTIEDTIKELLWKGRDASLGTWNAWDLSLQPQHRIYLATSSVSNGLRSFVENRWVEHVVIGSPFGIVGMTDTGKCEWLQLETKKSLQGLADSAVKRGLRPVDGDDVRAGLQLPDLDLQRALNRTGDIAVAPCEVQIDVDGNETIYGAVFPIEDPKCPPVELTYAAWKARQPARVVRN